MILCFGQEVNVVGSSDFLCCQALGEIGTQDKNQVVKKLFGNGEDWKYFGGVREVGDESGASRMGKYVLWYPKGSATKVIEMIFCYGRGVNVVGRSDFLCCQVLGEIGTQNKYQIVTKLFGDGGNRKSFNSTGGVGDGNGASRMEGYVLWYPKVNPTETIMVMLQWW